MSDKRHSTCPKCLQIRKHELENLAANLELWYGRVSRQEYQAKEIELRALQHKPIENTLGENFDIQLEEGKFFFSYRAACRKEDCGYAFTYKKEIDLENIGYEDAACMTINGEKVKGNPKRVAPDRSS